MPIDKMILDPMINPFRTMLKDIQAKNLSGPDVDKLVEIMRRLEALGQEHSDFNAFNGAVMQENLFGDFSTYYGKALASEAQKNQGTDGGGYDDAAFLKQSIDALKNAISEIRRSYEEAVNKAKSDNVKDDNSKEVAILNDPELIIKGIQDVIDLGEQEGMTFPRFLRLQIEKGLDKAMEGAVVARNGQEYTLNITKVNPNSPYHIIRESEKLEKFDEFAASGKFNLPNLKGLSYAYNDIDRAHDRDIAVWKNITDRWEDLLWQLSFWSLSYCSFAPSLEPWSMAKNPKESVIKTQKISPGIFKQKEKLLEKYHGIKFHDIFSHETFKWAVKYNFIDYSQEYVEFLMNKIYPACLPFNDLSKELIAKKEAFYKERREANPDRNMPVIRMKEFYDKTFEIGKYEKKFGAVPVIDSSAKPWNPDSFLK